MMEVRKTDEFDAWLSALTDHKAIAKIVTRIERLALGNPGDVKAVGEGVSEMRITYGSGLPRLLQANRQGNCVAFMRWGQGNPGQRH
jgi:putative addiction module killer protein